MSVVTKDTIQPSSGQALTIKDEGGTASITVQTDGDLTLAENAYLGSGKGIYFDGQTTSANFLNDYEEGTWTITNTNGSSISSQEAQYTKIGNIVQIQGLFIVASGSNTSTDFGGLPFTIKDNNASRALGFVPFQSEKSTAGFFYGIWGNDNTKNFFFKGPGSEYFNAGKEVYFNMTYTTDE